MKVLSINIQTPNLILRNLISRDVSQDYVDWLNDHEVNKYLSCANNFQTIETCIDYVRSFENKTDIALIGIFLKDSDLHIGNVTLMPSVDWINKVGTIGISIGRRSLIGKGLASEALSAVVKYCFYNLNLNHIQAGVNVSNIKSLNLFVRCGFKIGRLIKEANIVNGHFEDGYILFKNFDNPDICF